jgi:2-methylcitrate dehydratase
VTITTQDGRAFHKDIPNNFGNDPLTDEDLEEKFRQMAIKYIPEKQIQKIFSTIWNLEGLNDMGKLMALLVFKAR